MGSVGAPELLVILLVALLVLGPDKLPEAARQLGRARAEMRRMTSGAKAEFKAAMAEGASAADSTSPRQASSGNDVPPV